MANPHRGEATLWFGERGIKAKFDHEAIANIEDDLDKTIFEALKKPSVKFTLAAISRGVEAAGGSLSREEINELLYEAPDAFGGVLEQVIMAIGRAMQGDKFQAEVDKAKKKREAVQARLVRPIDSTGASSSLTPPEPD